MLSEPDLLRALRRHWEYSGRDEDVSHEIYHDDAILEFPQSGERFEGVHNFRELRRRYPADLAFHLRRVTHGDALVVTEYLISYDHAPWMFVVSIMQFRGERVAHERIYIMDGWEAPDWRQPWRSQSRADPLPPPPVKPQVDDHPRRRTRRPTARGGHGCSPTHLVSTEARSGGGMTRVRLSLRRTDPDGLGGGHQREHHGRRVNCPAAASPVGSIAGSASTTLRWHLL